jgi:hypothetical protein
MESAGLLRDCSAHTFSDAFSSALCVELLGQREVPRHTVGCQRLGEESATFPGCECDRSVRKRALVV